MFTFIISLGLGIWSGWKLKTTIDNIAPESKSALKEAVVAKYHKALGTDNNERKDVN